MCCVRDTQLIINSKKNPSTNKSTLGPDPHLSLLPNTHLLCMLSGELDLSRGPSTILDAQQETRSSKYCGFASGFPMCIVNWSQVGSIRQVYKTKMNRIRVKPAEYIHLQINTSIFEKFKIKDRYKKKQHWYLYMNLITIFIWREKRKKRKYPRY